MRRQITIMIVILILGILLASLSCFAETSQGYIDVKVDAPKNFEHSIMVNLTDKQGINYVVVAEKDNSWKANTALPVGDYNVDSVSFEVADPNYNLEFPREISIKQGVGTAFLISFNSTVKVQPEKDDVSKQQVTETKPTEHKTFIQRVENLFINIFKKNLISLTIIAALLLFLYKKNKENEKKE